jgi:hexosaminidase
MNLLPRPRRLRRLEGYAAPGTAPGPPRTDPSLPPEGYRLSVGPDRVEVAAGGPAGAFYAQATLDQLRRVGGGRLPCCEVEDWPDLPVRGVMLDVSRDKVPKLKTLLELVDRLAGWKVNQLQLYMEHTFAYQGHEEVWAAADPITPEEMDELDRHCRQRHVELVANQNCFGHFERWLKHERYRPLAMAPQGWRNPLGLIKAPTTLDPAKPEALALVRSLLGQLVPHCSGRFVHVGLDEPWEMPPERFPEYMGWISALRGLPELDGKQMLVWGDVLAAHPEALGQLPEGVTVCEWGYEDWHDFEGRTRALAEAGRPFWVAPGTSSWLTVVGRVDNMRANCERAARAALANGAEGLLNTDWGDKGHLQYLPVSEPGLAYGAAVSWCLQSNADLDLAAALDAHCFEDEAGVLGRALLSLGNAYLGVAPRIWNMSALVIHLYFPQLRLGDSITEGLSRPDLASVRQAVGEAVSSLQRARPRRPDGELVCDELAAAGRLVLHMCADAEERLAGDGQLASIPERRRRELAAGLEPIIEDHRRLWLARNRPGGLADSLAWLEHLRDCYLSGRVEPTWGDW